MASNTEQISKSSSDFAAEKNHDTTEVVHHDILPSADGLAEAMAYGKPSPWSKPLLKLYGYCAVAFLCSTMNGKLASYGTLIHCILLVEKVILNRKF